MDNTKSFLHHSIYRKSCRRCAQHSDRSSGQLPRPLRRSMRILTYRIQTGYPLPPVWFVITDKRNSKTNKRHTRKRINKSCFLPEWAPVTPNRCPVPLHILAQWSQTLRIISHEKDSRVLGYKCDFHCKKKFEIASPLNLPHLFAAQIIIYFWSSPEHARFYSIRNRFYNSSTVCGSGMRCWTTCLPRWKKDFHRDEERRPSWGRNTAQRRNCFDCSLRKENWTCT